MQAMPSVNLWPAAAAPALRLSSWDMTWMTVWSLPVLSRKYCLSYHKNTFKVLFLWSIICLILSKLSNVPFIVTGEKSPSQLSHIHRRFAPASPTRLQNIPSKPSSAPQTAEDSQEVTRQSKSVSSQKILKAQICSSMARHTPAILLQGVKSLLATPAALDFFSQCPFSNHYLDERNHGWLHSSLQ